MSRVQAKPNFFRSINQTQTKVAALGRLQNTQSLRDINTTGLSSAQIDAAVFMGSQPINGTQISDSANHLHLVRLNGKWAASSMTTIS